MNTNNSFLQAIKILIKESINSAPYNRTKQAIIVSNNGDNTYDIRFDGKLYTNIISYPNTRSLPLKHIVKVIIPNNQASQMYISAEGSPLIYYPVGSYYETSDTLFDPNTAWGGTWVLEEEGLFHISAGNNYVIGTAGGSATHNHTTGDHTLTINEMPSHTHTQNSHSHKAGASFVRYINKTSGLAKGSNGYKFFSEDSGLYTDGATATNKNTGGGQAHNHGNTGDSSNIPPHVPVNRWHRTA